MGIALDTTGEVSAIRLEGAIDIVLASELKAALVTAMQEGKNIEVSIAGASEFDLTAYQLIWAAGREAKRSGVRLACVGSLPRPACDALSLIGLEMRSLQV